MRIHVEPDAATLADGAATFIAQLVVHAVDERGIARVAFSGGSTPRLMLSILGQFPLPWDAVEVFQVDERVAPDGHRDRNLTMLETALPNATIHPMPVGSADPEVAARAYEGEVTQRLGWAPAFDVIQLGLGADGHTASWPPGHRFDEDRVVAHTPEFAGHARVTLTPTTVNRAREIVWLITGNDKQTVLERLCRPSPSVVADFPASLVRWEPGVQLFADEPAFLHP